MTLHDVTTVFLTLAAGALMGAIPGALIAVRQAPASQGARTFACARLVIAGGVVLTLVQALAYLAVPASDAPDPQHYVAALAAGLLIATPALVALARP